MLLYTSGEKILPYLRLPEKATAYSVATKAGKISFFSLLSQTIVGFGIL